MLKNRLVSVILIFSIFFAITNFESFALNSESIHQIENLKQTSAEVSQSSNTRSPLASPENIANYGEYLPEEQLNQFGTGAILNTPQGQSRNSNNSNTETNNNFLDTPLIIGINTLARNRIVDEFENEDLSEYAVYAIGHEFNNISPNALTDCACPINCPCVSPCMCVNQCSGSCLCDGSCSKPSDCDCFENCACIGDCTCVCTCPCTSEEHCICKFNCACAATGFCNCNSSSSNNNIGADGCYCSYNSLSFPENLLPSMIDNSALPYFPDIGDQGNSNSCTAWSIGYYQLTHNTALVRNRNANHYSDQYKMSPRFMYNLINNGLNIGTHPTDAMNVACSFGCATVEETGIVDYEFDDISTWNFGADIWESALSNKAKSAYIFQINSTNLTELKRLLTNGYIVSFSTSFNYWKYSTTTSPANEKICIAACRRRDTDPLGHMMTIVGYDDNVRVDIDKSGTIEDSEIGALKVANSWGTSYGNDGYCWVSYSALSVQSDDDVSKVPVIENNWGYFLEPTINYTPLLLAEVTLNTARRNDLNLAFAVSDNNSVPSSEDYIPVTEYLQRSFISNSCWLPKQNNSSIAFKNHYAYTNSANFWYVGDNLNPTGASFRFDLTPVIQKYYNEHSQELSTWSESPNGVSDLRFYIRITDSDYNHYPNFLTSFKVKDSKNNFLSDDAISSQLEVNGESKTASTNYEIKPVLITADKNFVITFNNPLVKETIANGILVKPKIAHNSYASDIAVEKIPNTAGTQVTIKPPAIDSTTATNIQYKENQYYTISIAYPIETLGRNTLASPTMLDFYVMQPITETDQEDSQ